MSKNTMSVQSEVFAEIAKGIDAARAAGEKVVGTVGLEVPAKKLTKAQLALLAIEEKMALELAEKCTEHATKYKRIITQSRNTMKTWAEIGATLFEMRKRFINEDGNTDTKGFGAAVNDSPLSIITKRDRADMIWLFENAVIIATFKKATDYSGNSVQILRSNVKKWIKAKNADEVEAYAIENGEVVAVEPTEQPEAPEGSGEAGTDIVEKSLDDEALVLHILDLCKANNLEPKHIAIMLKNAAK
tara:strand:- start:2179 stop:2913 length:735 start_codon:yes stop_codon:yes gene_type:complete